MTKEQYQAAEALMDDITDVDYQIRSMESLRGAGGISIVPTQKVLDAIINGLREEKKALERKFEAL